MSLEFKGTTVKIYRMRSSFTVSDEVINSLNAESFITKLHDLKVSYELRRARIQIEWDERKQRMKGIKQSTYDVIHKHISE